MRIKIKTDTDSPCSSCGRVALSPSNCIFALASMPLKDLIFFANGRQVFLAIKKRGRNISDSRVYLRYRRVGMKEFFKFMQIAQWVFQLSSHFEKALEIWTKKTKYVYCKIATFRNNKGSNWLKGI